MAVVKKKLSHHETWVVQNAHAEASELHRHADSLLQIRLDQITMAHEIPDGTEVSFQRGDDDLLYITYDDGVPKLQIYDERNHAADATVAQDDEC